MILPVVVHNLQHDHLLELKEELARHAQANGEPLILRYDITPPDSLRLEVRCVSQYRPAVQRLTGIECHLPTDNGELAARGSVANLLEKPEYDLSLVARDVPMSYAVAFARRSVSR